MRLESPDFSRARLVNRPNRSREEGLSKFPTLTLRQALGLFSNTLSEADIALPSGAFRSAFDGASAITSAKGPACHGGKQNKGNEEALIGSVSHQFSGPFLDRPATCRNPSQPLFTRDLFLHSCVPC